jgi:hypothetical protein
MSYTYFAASLPALRPDAAPPFSEEEFTALCGGHLGTADLAALAALRSGGESPHKFVRKWRDFETQLRNACAALRAAKLGVDAAKWRRPHAGFSVAVETAAAAAFAEPDAMRRDAAIKKILWDGAEEIAGLDQFSAGAVFAYFVRLRILIDRSKAGAEAGMSRIKQLSTTESTK